MKTAAILFLVLFIAATAIYAANLSAVAPAECTATKAVSVYKGPDQNTDLVDELSEGEKTIVTARVGTFFEVTTPRLVTGYVDSAFCK